MTPPNASTRSDHVKMGIGIPDVALPVDLHPLAPESRALLAGKRPMHVRAYPSLGPASSMPRQRGGFLCREPAQDEGDVPRHDIHVDGNAPIGRELAGWNRGHDADHLRANTGKGD